MEISLPPDSKVLVVDDLPANLLIAQGLLAPYDMIIDTAASGEEAIEKVKSHGYDIILMDHMMPEMDGIETTSAIRALEKELAEKSVEFPVETPKLLELPSGVPIIAMTANAMQGMKKYYLEHGFQDYLSKPISPEALDDIITQWVPNCTRAARIGKTEIPPANIAVELESQRLDILNHYRASFASVPEAEWQTKFDSAYFERFTALVESLDTTGLQEQAVTVRAALIEAGRRGDAQKIRETLPAFYELLREKKNRGPAGNKTSLADESLREILPRLKKAILSGETGTAETIIGEMGALSLQAPGRELYFLLYDLLLAGEAEKALGAISLWEKLAQIRYY